MATPKKNLIIKEIEGVPNLLEVWTPAPAQAEELIAAIEGVVYVCQNILGGCLDVRLNPCYSKAEIRAEIRAALSEQQQLDRPSYQERLRRKRHRVAYPRWPEKTVADMRIGEVGYIVSWAVGNWSGLHTLNGLNLSYPVHAREFGTADTPIYRTETGWVVGGKVFTEKVQDVFGGTIAAMHLGETGYIVSRAVEGDLDKRYTVFRYPVPSADTHICRTNSGWVVGGRVFTEPK